MADTYIIDGYNLIHALGMIQKNMEAGGLERSRRMLLAFLAKAFGPDCPRVTVVFDAKQAPPRVSRQQVSHGLTVHFAPKDQSADDWIETLIEQHAEPRSLVVVSNDVRLQTAAQRAGARGWSHEGLLDFVEKRTVPDATPPGEVRSHDLTPEEKQRWLQEFKDLENDPELKEFFEMDRFE